MKSTLCIDAGASSSKWALFVPPSSLRIGRSAHITGHIFDDVEWDRTKSAIEVIARETKHEVDVSILWITKWYSWRFRMRHSNANTKEYAVSSLVRCRMVEGA